MVRRQPATMTRFPLTQTTTPQPNNNNNNNNYTQPRQLDQA